MTTSISSEDTAVTSLPKLLIVENHGPTQTFVRYVLQDAYALTVVDTPQAAIKASEETPFNAVLVDIALQAPHDGVELMNTLRDVDAYRDTPIAAMTAYAMPGDKKRFLEMGFDAYISKPFVRAEMMDLVETLLPQARLS